MGTTDTDTGMINTDAGTANNPCTLCVPLKNKGTCIKALYASLLDVVV